MKLNARGPCTQLWQSRVKTGARLRAPRSMLWQPGQKRIQAGCAGRFKCAKSRKYATLSRDIGVGAEPCRSTAPSCPKSGAFFNPNKCRHLAVPAVSHLSIIRICFLFKNIQTWLCRESFSSYTLLCKSFESCLRMRSFLFT